MQIFHLINKITLSFYDKNLEKEYKEYFIERFLEQIKTAMFFGIIVYSFFGFLDYALYPDFYTDLLAIRFKIVVPFFILLLILMHYKSSFDFINIIVVAGVLAGGFGIVRMINIIQKYGYENNIYFSGLLLVAFFAYTFFKIRFLYALVSGLLIIAGYEYVSVYVDRISSKALFANNFFFLSTNLIGLIINYLMELDSRKYFLLYRKLYKEKENLTIDNVKLERLAHIDGLTEIPNKRFFLEYLNYIWNQNNHHNVSILMIDVDFFKNYNDEYGHLAGDKCLQTIATTLNNLIRKSKDIVARFGGEEFVILLRDTDKKGAFELAKRIREKIKSLKIPHNTSKVSNIVTVSIGVATSSPDKMDFETLINLADNALYKAKKGGRDKIC